MTSDVGLKTNARNRADVYDRTLVNLHRVIAVSFYRYAWDCLECWREVILVCARPTKTASLCLSSLEKSNYALPSDLFDVRIVLGFICCSLMFTTDHVLDRRVPNPYRINLTINLGADCDYIFRRLIRAPLPYTYHMVKVNALLSSFCLPIFLQILLPTLPSFCSSL